MPTSSSEQASPASAQPTSHTSYTHLSVEERSLLDLLLTKQSSSSCAPTQGRGLPKQSLLTQTT